MKKLYYKYRKTIAYIFVIGFFAIDVIIEFINGETGFDFIIESGFILVLFYMLYKQVEEIKSTSLKLNIAEDRLYTLQLDIDQVIEDQLNAMSLTKAEKHIAWMLIRGHSFKDISATRAVTESTIYRQTANIYSKANVKSLHEFTSIFFNDLINIVK